MSPPDVLRGSQPGESSSFVSIGKRTIKDGECAAYWKQNGKYRQIIGPRRKYFFMSTIRFLPRFVANQGQYLEVNFKDGRKEHLRGPLTLFKDPIEHVSVLVHQAMSLNSFERLVVYREDPDTSAVKRRIIHGPCVFVPSADEYIHTFSWSGNDYSKADNTMKVSVPKAEVFQKLRVIPDKLAVTIRGVHTSDMVEAQLELMIFFALEDVARMLDSTKDPIGDFISAMTADAVAYGSKHTYEEVIEKTEHLNALATFPTLVARAAEMGFVVQRVAHRGVKAPAAKVHHAMQKKAELQAQEVSDLKLHHACARSERERAMRTASTQNAVALSKLEHDEKMRQMEREFELQLAHLANLHELGIDLTKMLCIREMRPDKGGKPLYLEPTQPLAMINVLPGSSSSKGPAIPHERE